MLLTLILLVGGIWLLGPRERVVWPAPFDETQLHGGAAAYLAAVEAGFDDITPGVEKRIVWAGEPEVRTPWAVVYIHGFSATSQEVRPLPDKVADGLGANLVLTRLAGHGRGSAAMAGPTVQDWLADVGEALAVARHVGERVLVLATSTGATLATIAASEPQMMRDVAGLVLISPNYQVQARAARILTWPAARWWLPLVAGRERSFAPRSADQARFWTMRYPTVAVLPMGAATALARALDASKITTPAMFVFADGDRVVDPRATRALARTWGGDVTLHVVRPGARDDPQAHVIAGDIMSPDQTDPLAGAILDWAGRL